MSFTDARPDELVLARLAAALADTGYLIVDRIFPPALAQALRDECLAAEQVPFRPAGTGRRRGHQQTSAVRSDEICWLDGTTAPRRAYLAYMEGLRSGLNRRLLLGLLHNECHYARYLPGARYRTHLDAFGGRRNRVLSTVLYLNEGWQQADGGELLLYAPEEPAVAQQVQTGSAALDLSRHRHHQHHEVEQAGTQPACEPSAAERRVLERIVPDMGRLVVFLSERFPHEVLPASRTRYSLAGWFTVQQGPATLA